MILKKINFQPLYRKIEGIFKKNLPSGIFNKLRKILLKEIKELARANFLCYQANMKIIEERKKQQINTDLISDMEFQARTVGEQRVRAKTEINALLSRVYPLKRPKKIVFTDWMSDDIVYSVGEMVDRLIIEFIKINDYRNQLKYNKDKKSAKLLKIKISLAHDWERRVDKYLGSKLIEVNKKGYYEFLAETRTYDLKSIDK